MPLPLVYRDVNVRAIASYDGTELATGKGILNVYLATALSGANVVLTESTFYGDPGYVEAFDTQTIDSDFDLEIANNFTIDGTATINVPYMLRSVTANQNWVRGISLNIRKWDGTTETNLISGSHLIKLFRGAGTDREFCYTQNVVVPKTFFSAGDTLRITLGSTSAAGAGNEQRIYFGTNPKATSVKLVSDDADTFFDGAINSASVISLPVKIDI